MISKLLHTQIEFAKQYKNNTTQGTVPSQSLAGEVTVLEQCPSSLSSHSPSLSSLRHPVTVHTAIVLKEGGREEGGRGEGRRPRGKNRRNSMRHDVIYRKQHINIDVCA